jgi:spermidine synthase
MQEGQRMWDELASARLPDGNMMMLYRRDHEYEICTGGLLLMSNQAYGSEEALATIGCRGLEGERTVLVGGLGLGYTLRATLDMLDEGATVVLAELLPAIVEWNREMLGHLADHPLTDPRVEMAIGDVAETIRRSEGRFDAMLLDVDNGPKAFTQSSNASLYGDQGLAEMFAALKPGGVLAVWSAWADRKFEHRLKYTGFLTEVHKVPARLKKGGPEHTIFLGRKPSAERGW